MEGGSSLLQPTALDTLRSHVPPGIATCASLLDPTLSFPPLLHCNPSIYLLINIYINVNIQSCMYKYIYKHLHIHINVHFPYKYTISSLSLSSIPLLDLSSLPLSLTLQATTPESDTNPCLPPSSKSITCRACVQIKRKHRDDVSQTKG